MPQAVWLKEDDLVLVGRPLQAAQKDEKLHSARIQMEIVLLIFRRMVPYRAWDSWKGHGIFFKEL
jgi:hypothetical protein